MTPALWVTLFAVVGTVLLLAEVLLPTHGLLGVIGGASLAVAIGFCFAVNQWVGLAALIVTVVAAPFVFAGAMKWYPSTPVGRRMILPDRPDAPLAPLVRIGQIGVATTELRPGGEVEFGDLRLQSTSESGLIPPGVRVRVTALTDGRPRVRTVQ